MNTDFDNQLTSAFRAMRKAGLLAYKNFSCCGSCAGFELSQKAEALKKAGKGDNIKGCAFYHAQDNDNKKEGRNFFVGYGSMDTQEFGQIGLDSVEVGKLVVECFTAAGIKTIWNGTEAYRIEVVNPEPQKSRWF